MAYKTRQELAEELGISVRTLYRWIKKEQIEISSKRLSPAEWELVIKKFGHKVTE